MSRQAYGRRHRPLDDLRLCQTVRWPRPPEQRTGTGHDGVDLPAPTPNGADSVEHARAENMPPHAEPGPVVLLVDDELAVRRVVVEVLSDLGYTVLKAANSQSGLRIIETRARIDLLITDGGLPGGMNGGQLADAARELRSGLKVLFLTGYAESAAVGNGRMEEGMEVMTKPFDRDKFAAKVEGMTSG